MRVVLGSEAGGTMVHEAIGHGLEGDSVSKDQSVYSGRVGEKVASELVSVVDDATLEGRRGSYVFDDEGHPAERTLLVDKGILKGYMHNRYSAERLKVSSTGNARRESFRHRPIVRMSNTMIAPLDSNPDSIILSVDDGLYVARMGGGQVDTSTGDFVFKVNEGYMIKNGKIGSPVRGATLIGNGPRILTQIDMVGNDLGFGIGSCGKDGQYVPVSDAQPTMRIPSITVGGEA
jgi:TldD protein